MMNEHVSKAGEPSPTVTGERSPITRDEQTALERLGVPSKLIRAVRMGNQPFSAILSHVQKVMTWRASESFPYSY